MSTKKKIAIVGSGNWGSAIAKIIGNNVLAMPKQFVEEVRIWVFEEKVNGRNLTEIINEDHENVKYLPGIQLPINIKAIPDVADAVHEADILVFVLPHQFMPRICLQISDKVKDGAIAVSLIKEVMGCGVCKMSYLLYLDTFMESTGLRYPSSPSLDSLDAEGFDRHEGGGILLISDVIRTSLNIPCAVLMGANIANEVACENYCEATIGCKDHDRGLMLKNVFQTRYFRIVVVKDEQTVEVCGALKNIVACGAGFCDGLGHGNNTKAAIIRLGLMEMVHFCKIFYPGSNQSTFLESCGVADLVTTCYGGRNRRVSEAFAKTGKTLEELEQEMLNGQKLQGPPTADEVNFMLKSKSMEDRFPLFTAVCKICNGDMKVEDMILCLKNHPEHL